MSPIAICAVLLLVVTLQLPLVTKTERLLPDGLSKKVRRCGASDGIVLI